MKSIQLTLLASALFIAACVPERDFRPHVQGGDAERGRVALKELECGACHVIPGVGGAHSNVGPPLENYSRHSYIAGKWPNEPERLIAWILDPPAMAPLTAMPKVAMSERDARDIAAYLYELD